MSKKEPNRQAYRLVLTWPANARRTSRIRPPRRLDPERDLSPKVDRTDAAEMEAARADLEAEQKRRDEAYADRLAAAPPLPDSICLKIPRAPELGLKRRRTVRFHTRSTDSPEILATDHIWELTEAEALYVHRRVVGNQVTKFGFPLSAIARIERLPNYTPPASGESAASDADDIPNA